MALLGLRSPGRSSGNDSPEVGTWEKSCQWRRRSGSCSRHCWGPQPLSLEPYFVELAGLSSNSLRVLLLAGTCSACTQAS